MRNIKLVSGFAVCGFLLSFVFGLFSHSNFLSILVKALICCIIFGILGFGIDIVFSKFLLDETGSEISGEAGTNPKNVSSSAEPAKGRIVDLVVQDEELSPGESGNAFIVGANHQMLNENDIRGKSVSGMNSNSNEGFVPLRKYETVENFSSTESENPNIMHSQDVKETGQSEAVMNSGAIQNEDNTLDVLPDMSYMSDEQSSEDQDNSPEESGFETSFATTTSKKSSDVNTDDYKDTALIAKAISSVLSQEST